MCSAMKTALALLTCLAIANAVSKPFPPDKTAMYTYSGVVKTGVFDPASFASEVGISAKLYIKHHDEEPRGLLMVLRDIKMGSGVGSTDQIEPMTPDRPIAESNLALQKPIVMIYNEAGQITGMSMDPSMPSWASNILRGIVSMLQLDLPNIKFTEPFKPYSFTTKENNIYGNCSVSYDIYRKEGADVSENKFMIQKFGSSAMCWTNFTMSSYTYGDVQGMTESPLTTTMSETIEVENQGENILIKKIEAHHEMNHFAWKGQSEAYYIRDEAIITFDKFIDSIELPSITPAPAVNITYQEPKMRLAPDAAIDVTQKHHISQEKTIAIFKALLSEAAAYIQENHVDMADPDFKHGQTITWMMDVMKGLQYSSLETIFSEYEAATSAPNSIIKQIFIGMLPHIGTTATWNFAMYLVKTKKISTFEIVEMLSTIALKLREPSIDHNVAIDGLLAAKETLDPVIIKSIILCRASLFYRIFKNTDHPENNPIFKAWVDHIYDRIINEPSHEMKIVYLMAFKNLRIGNIDRLAEIIRGDIQMPIAIRLNAIWAIENSNSNFATIHNLLWPLLVSPNTPLNLRIAAYDILIRQDKTDHMWKIHWFMMFEKNTHFYNYHYTTILGLANSVNPRDARLRSCAIKILRMTKVPQTVSYPRSASWIMDAVDQIHGYGDMFEASIILNELTGNPAIIRIKHSMIKDTHTVNDFEIYVSIEGIDQTTMSKILTGKNVIDLLKQVASDMPAIQDPHVDVMVTFHGQVSLVHHYTGASIPTMMHDMQKIIAQYSSKLKYTKTHIAYMILNEIHTFSPLGLPVKLDTRGPLVQWMDFDYEMVSSTEIKLKIDSRLWAHGGFRMSFFSPVCDSWHSVGRSTALDARFGITANIEMNFETGAFKITFPINNELQNPIIGIRTYNKDIVGITPVHMFDEMTPETQIEDFTTYKTISEAPEVTKFVKDSIHNEDTGLQYLGAIFDCENGENLSWMNKKWMEIFIKDRISDWNNMNTIQWNGFVGITQMLTRYWLSPRVGKCGYIFKIQPSIHYPMRHIEFKFENIDGKEDNIHAQLTAVPMSEDKFSRTWDLKLIHSRSEDRRQLIQTINITKIIKETWDFNISIIAEKNYPMLPNDLLKAGDDKEVITRNIHMTFHQNGPYPEEWIGMTDIRIREEIDEDQRKKIGNSKACTSCKNDMNNPWLKGAASNIPLTRECLNDIIDHTTMRKYTVDVKWQNVTEIITAVLDKVHGIIDSIFKPNCDHKPEHSQPDSMTIVAHFPEDLRKFRMSVMTPKSHFNLWDMSPLFWNEYPQIRGIGWSPINDWRWTMLDNSRSNIAFIKKYPEWKVCSLYPNFTMTLDGGRFSYLMPEEYTLMSGDYVSQSYAIFTKRIGEKIGLIIYDPNNVIEIIPGTKVEIKINGETHGDWQKVVNGGFDILNGNWPFRVTKWEEQINIEWDKKPLMIVYSSNGVSAFIDKDLQGKIAGLCGHMDGSHTTTIPKAYILNI